MATQTRVGEFRYYGAVPAPKARNLAEWKWLEDRVVAFKDSLR